MFSILSLEFRPCWWGLCYFLLILLFSVQSGGGVWLVSSHCTIFLRNPPVSFSVTISPLLFPSCLVRQEERSTGVARGNWNEECRSSITAEENGRGSLPKTRKQTGSPETTYSRWPCNSEQRCTFQRLSDPLKKESSMHGGWQGKRQSSFSGLT